MCITALGSLITVSICKSKLGHSVEKKLGSSFFCGLREGEGRINLAITTVKWTCGGFGVCLLFGFGFRFCLFGCFFSQSLFQVYLFF